MAFSGSRRLRSFTHKGFTGSLNGRRRDFNRFLNLFIGVSGSKLAFIRFQQDLARVSFTMLGFR